jgi:hypothetical protein
MIVLAPLKGAIATNEHGFARQLMRFECVDRGVLMAFKGAARDAACVTPTAPYGLRLFFGAEPRVNLYNR